MRKKLLTLALSLLALATLSTGSGAQVDGGKCPGHFGGADFMCHLIRGTSCTYCVYNCLGDPYTWNMCGVVR